MPSGGSAQPPRIRRGDGALVPAAEFLIGLAGVEDQPGDLVREGRDVHHAGLLGSSSGAAALHRDLGDSLLPWLSSLAAGGMKSRHLVRVICFLHRACSSGSSLALMEQDR
jgi:hypothetical protein